MLMFRHVVQILEEKRVMINCLPHETGGPSSSKQEKFCSPHVG